MRVTIIGTGYVGLVTGACLAKFGHCVTCVDVDAGKVERLCGGEVPIYEPGLDTLVAEQAASGRLRFVAEYGAGVPDAEAIFICVGTPSRPDGNADMSCVEAAARSLGEHLGAGYTVIINKSTVPIGSGDWVGMLIRQGITNRTNRELRQREEGGATLVAGTAAVATRSQPLPVFDIVSNPEFLREGSAITDALNPDRIIIGAENERAEERMRALYAPLLEDNRRRGQEIPFVVTDRASAEMIKYAANAFLATKISFINEIANICERVGADAQEVARGIGLDGRIGGAFLQAGIGWGGSCFPKDLASLVHTAREYGYDAKLLDSVRSVNQAQRMAVIRKLQERLKLIKGKTITLWGLAFKPGTDDMRDAPSLDIAARLTEMGAEVRAYDPEAMTAARSRGVQAELCPDLYEAARDADAVVLVTEWPAFLEADFARLRSVMRRPLLVDGRNALARADILSYGFEYCGIGR